MLQKKGTAHRRNLSYIYVNESWGQVTGDGEVGFGAVCYAIMPTYHFVLFGVNRSFCHSIHIGPELWREPQSRCS